MGENIRFLVFGARLTSLRMMENYLLSDVFCKYFLLVCDLPFNFSNSMLAGCQWLMPVILATWEAEIRRITVQGQTG
jgi:hypothetical protein